MLTYLILLLSAFAGLQLHLSCWSVCVCVCVCKRFTVCVTCAHMRSCVHSCICVHMIWNHSAVLFCVSTFVCCWLYMITTEPVNLSLSMSTWSSCTCTMMRAITGTLLYQQLILVSIMQLQGVKCYWSTHCPACGQPTVSDMHLHWQATTNQGAKPHHMPHTSILGHLTGSRSAWLTGMQSGYRLDHVAFF